MAATSSPAKSVVTIPAAIRTTLDTEYPGWKLAPVTPQIDDEFKKHRANRSPSFVVGDFDHDGHLDYALQIVLTTPELDEQIIMVFLARGQAYEESILESMGLDRSVYLWVSAKPISETGPNGQEKKVNKTVLIVLGGPIGETTYAFEDGKFAEMAPAEHTDAQDPSVPRVDAPQETP